MNTFRLYIAWLLSVNIFSGCSNDDDPVKDNGAQNAQITITEYHLEIWWGFWLSEIYTNSTRMIQKTILLKGNQSLL